MEKSPVCFAFLFSILLAGCCASDTFTIEFETGPDDMGKPCEPLCKEVILRESDTNTFEFVDCEAITSKDGAPAISCNYEGTTCTTELH
jgi:hypothetical protein